MNIYSYEEAFERSKEYFDGDDLAAKVFIDKYALRDKEGNILEDTPDKMHRRLAKEFARIEKGKFKEPLLEDEIYEYLKDFKYIIPGGSGLSGIGDIYRYTSLSNCFVGKSPLDSYSSICKADEEIVSISKRRGGIGLDVSNFRPVGAATSNASKTSTGIVPFCERFSNTIREVGQCLLGDTMVLTFNGLKPISEVKIGDRVWSKEKWIDVNNVVVNKKPCVEIKTKHGKKIVCSKEHRFHSSNGEKQVVDFKIGDEITQIVGEGWTGKNIDLRCEVFEKNIYNNSNRLNTDIILPKILDEKLSYVLGYSYGYSYGDGYIGRQKNGENIELSLSCSDDWEGIKTKLSNNIKESFNYQVAVKTSDDACENLRIFSRLILDFLSKNNILKQKAGDLIFPNKILKAKKDEVFAFLSGYFDADGCAQKSKKVYKFASIDEEFLLIIQNILSAFGVNSKIYKQERCRKEWRDIYSLSINGRKSQTVFKKLMSQSIKIKNTIFEPKLRDCTRSIYKTSDFSTLASRHNYIINNDQYVSYSACDRLKTDLGITKDIFLLQDEVCSIKEYDNGEEQEVYDLCLDSEHLFFANGLYAHNSGRRGALILTLSVHHPEIMNFITMKRDLTKVNGANISVRLMDEFLKAVENEEEYEQRWPVNAHDTFTHKILNKVSAKEVWDQIIYSAWETGEPGILFWDNIIKESPADCYPDFQSVSTNPCLVGDTKISTDQGDISIFEIIDNGIENYKVKTYNEKLNKIELEDIIFGEKTKENTDIIEIEMEDGEKLQLTPDHKVYTKNRGYVDAAFLNEDDIILKIKNKK